MTENIKLLPYKPDGFTHQFKRVLSQSIEKPVYTFEDGLILPSDIGKAVEYGKVAYADEDSFINPGDIIQYQLLDREVKEMLDVVIIDGIEYDVVYEHTIIAYNDKPTIRIFALPVGKMEVNEDGLISPDTATGLTIKGIVHAAPEGYSVKPGDKIEYRRNEQGIYPTIFIDGVNYDVLYERDIYLINGKVMPFRCIVKLDKAAQQRKRTRTSEGFVVPQQFIHMKRNLQYAEVVEIGEEFQSHYPDLHVGDTAIFHHSVESQPARIIKQDRGKNQVLNFEYLILDSWQDGNIEVFGKMKPHAVIKNEFVVVPFNGQIIMDWNFHTFTDNLGTGIDSELIGNLDTDLDKCIDIFDYRETFANKKKAVFEAFKTKSGGLIAQLSQIDRTQPGQNDKYLRLESQLLETRRDAIKSAAWFQKDHFLVCNSRYPHANDSYVAIDKLLYPIELKGRKFLIANPNYLIANIIYHMSSTNHLTITGKTLQPLGDLILVELIPEEAPDNGLIMPENLKEEPQKATVIAVGPLVTSVEAGDGVFIRRRTGLDVQWEGKSYKFARINTEIVAKF